MEPLGLLALLAYCGVVFVLPPVLGRWAARSGKGRIPFLIVMGLFAIVGIGILLSIPDAQKKLHDAEFLKSYDNPHHLEDYAIGVTYAMPVLGVTILIGVALGLCFYWATPGPEEKDQKDAPHNTLDR